MKKILLIILILLVCGCATQANDIWTRLKLTSLIQDWTEDEWEALGRDWKECHGQAVHEPIPHPGFRWIPIWGSFYVSRQWDRIAEKCMQEKGHEVECDYHFITFYGAPTLIRREK